jgi:hypothetical protein
MYYYWGFGLTISSEIEFPELLPIDFVPAPDLSITLGIIPETLTREDVEHTPVVSIGPNQYLLKLFNIANYFASNGNSIIVEPLQANDSKSLRLFLLNSVMSALLYQRDKVMLHASAIEVEDGVALFCGPANSGKSALAAGMQLRGYQIFSDEVCLIAPSVDNNFEATASYPVYKLWSDTFKKTCIKLPDDDYKIRPELGKYGIFYHENFSTDARTIKHVFVLNRHQQKKPVSIIKIVPVDGFTRLHNNTFYRMQIKPMKKQALSFSLISKLVNVTPVFKIDWYENENSIADICNLIEKKLSTNE